jgi:hypothetical protein
MYYRFQAYVGLISEPISRPRHLAEIFKENHENNPGREFG